MELEKMLRKFGEEVIENPNVVKVAWNYKFDDQIFQKYNIYYRGVCLDGMLAKYLLNEEKPNDLKSMVRRYLPEYGDYESKINSIRFHGIKRNGTSLPLWMSRY